MRKTADALFSVGFEKQML